MLVQLVFSIGAQCDIDYIYILFHTGQQADHTPEFSIGLAVGLLTHSSTVLDHTRSAGSITLNGLDLAGRYLCYNIGMVSPQAVGEKDHHPWL